MPRDPSREPRPDGGDAGAQAPRSLGHHHHSVKPARLRSTPRWLARCSTCALLVAALVAGTTARADADLTTDRDDDGGFSVAVLPAVWITPAPANALEPDRVVAAHWSAREPALQLVEARATAEAVAARGTDCAEEISCLQEVGEALGAAKVAVVRIGNLGETTVIRLSVVDVSQGALEQTLQEVVGGDDEATLRAGLEALAARYAQGLEQQRVAPWYTQWWVWAAGGASALLLAVGVTAVALLLLAPGSDDGPDVIITPP